MKAKSYLNHLKLNMGQKYSTSTKNWTIDDWVFGTDDNALTMELVIGELKQIPIKYLGGRKIANDTSMQRLQQDLLAFDQTLKQIFLRRKTNKQSKTPYYDQNEYSIPEEDENQLLLFYADDEPQTTTKHSSWRCKYCNKKIKSTDTICRRCKQLDTKF